MDRENEPMSETAILPLVDVVKKEWKKDNVITFLQRKDLNLDLDDEDIEIIRSKKYSLIFFVFFIIFANNTEYLLILVLFFPASYRQTRPKNTFALS
ncbi:hypothetical protein RclHR1_22560002 [Rhizophagus clarus]|uniref:Uncharacterized protein n=1 Tax=Rhizophagus clarus TaxID=94130 RepID=A0A2Z6QWL0_9GLOM|nr:hypothetical protein RclHR1_22560002 [Rhizophagus clarus]